MTLVVDISKYQGDAPGQALAGAGFAGVIDQPLGNPYYADQLASCQAAGLAILAAYAFAYPGDGAQLCDALLAAMLGPEQRVVIDAEVAGITADEVLAFGVRARQWNPNVRPVLYGSTSYLAANYGGSPMIGALFDAWIAEYHADLTAANLPPAPPPFTRWIGWQYSSSYPVPGVGNGLVDASVFLELEPATAAAPTPEDDMRILCSAGPFGDIAALVDGGLILNDPDHLWVSDAQHPAAFGVPGQAIAWNAATGHKYDYGFIELEMMNRLIANSILTPPATVDTAAVAQQIVTGLGANFAGQVARQVLALEAHALATVTS
jgi:hypothetical protein